MKSLTTVTKSCRENECNKAPQWVRADEFKQHDPSFVASSHAHRMATVGEMAAGMAHDFRNVLQTLSSTLELIDTLHTNPEAVRRLASSGLRTIERGTGLAQRFLALCRH
jgi:signal transduction histidine kinase